MKKMLSEMLPVGAMIPLNEEEIEYSYANEYQGSPVTYSLPQAIPVDIKSIPVASVASQTLGEDILSLPVVQPLRKKKCEEVALGSAAVVSPTSVIAFKESCRDHSQCESSSKSSILDGSSKLGSSRGIDNSGALESDENSGYSHEITSESASNVSCEAQDRYDSVTKKHARRVSVVTFCEEDSTNTTTDGSITSESEYTHRRKEPSVNAHKGSCYWCSKGNRFTEKEVCLVCSAKYCAKCVRRAMGSMPEGRKCVTCIGYAVDESKRMSLGKCSRMLKMLLTKSEIRQIMRNEKSCKVNQIEAKRVYVNGKRLSQQELILLQNCPNPPNNIQLEHYWYDKVSGLWGKDGQKPCSIISAHLEVGGDIQPNASNGNTNVFINNREITKAELWLLKWSKVQCAGRPHYWLDESGSYQEEGQKNVQGNLWDKAGIKLLCTVLSLPYPSKRLANYPANKVHNVVSGAFSQDAKQQSLQKLLLVGFNGSGTSTIFKQAKMLYEVEPFSGHDLLDIKLMIQRNLYSYLGLLLLGRERFEEEILAERRKELLSQPDSTGSIDGGNGPTIYSIGPRLKEFSDWLINDTKSGNLSVPSASATHDYGQLIEALWKDPAIKATFDRRNELEMLPSVASYFLERVVDISREDYEPSNMDILYAEGISSSNGIADMDFIFPQQVKQRISEGADHPPDPLLRYQLIRVDARSLGERCKWLDMFEDVKMVIFCVSLSDYDQVCDDRSGVLINKILASKKLFEEIITHPTFGKMDFLLILSKYDLLEEKIEQVPLSECDWFDDFNLVRSNYPSNDNNFNYIASPAEQAFHYIAAKFKKLFSSLTGRKLYVSLVNGLEVDTVHQALTYGREILKWDEERNNVDIYDSRSNTVTA